MDSQYIISYFCNSPRDFAAIMRVFNIATRDTIEADVRKSFGQKGMMILRRGNSPLHLCNSHTFSSMSSFFIAKRRDRFVVDALMSLGQPNTPFHNMRLQERTSARKNSFNDTSYNNIYES